MRTPTRAHISRLVPVSALVVALIGAEGCATLRSTRSAYDLGPNGIARSQLRLRDALVNSDFATALAYPEDDELLRELMVGASSYYASQFARSAAVFDSAALLADDRITASVSKDIGALLTNDMARPYTPRRTERLFIAYYGMMSYARLEQWPDAAVEARRLASLLAQYGADMSDAERGTRATMHYLTGVVFEKAGEKEEAKVAYRIAGALAPSLVDSARGRRNSDEGDMLVVVERGFVAHRTSESLNLFIDDDRPDSSRTHDREGSARIVSRAVSDIANGSYTGGPRPGRHHEHDEDAGYWLAVSIPSLRRSSRLAGEPDVAVDPAGKAALRFTADVDDATEEDARRERTEWLTRAVVRASAKYVVAKAVKDKNGEVAGQIANIGASLLERADIRSWHLLPQRITLVRVRTRTGVRHATVNFGDATEAVDAGIVRVQAGQVALATVRIWKQPAPRLVAER